MIVSHFEGSAVQLIYGEWDEQLGSPEAAVSVQRDAGTAIVIRQRDREIVVDATMARELARVLLREARIREAEATA